MLYPSYFCEDVTGRILVNPTSDDFFPEVFTKPPVKKFPRPPEFSESEVIVISAEERFDGPNKAGRKFFGRRVK